MSLIVLPDHVVSPWHEPNYLLAFGLHRISARHTWFCNEQRAVQDHSCFVLARGLTIEELIEVLYRY